NFLSSPTLPALLALVVVPAQAREARLTAWAQAPRLAAGSGPFSVRPALVVQSHVDAVPARCAGGAGRRRYSHHLLLAFTGLSLARMVHRRERCPRGHRVGPRAFWPSPERLGPAAAAGRRQNAGT